MKKIALCLSVLLLGVFNIRAQSVAPSPSPSPGHDISFDMVPTAGLTGKLLKAGAHVNVHSAGIAEVMEVATLGYHLIRTSTSLLSKNRQPNLACLGIRATSKLTARGTVLPCSLAASALRPSLFRRARRRLRWSLTIPSPIAPLAPSSAASTPTTVDCGLIRRSMPRTPERCQRNSVQWRRKRRSPNP